MTGSTTCCHQILKLVVNIRLVEDLMMSAQIAFYRPNFLTVEQLKQNTDIVENNSSVLLSLDKKITPKKLISI
jgi:hypothetical protein